MEESLLAHLLGIVQDMIAGRPSIPAPCPAAEDPALGALAQGIRELGRQYAESYPFILELAKGNLEGDAPPRNSFAAPYKQLQAELRHLTWQIQEVSKGDLGHRVAFSGDFARSINAMIGALSEKQRLDEQNREYAQLFRTIFETSADGLLIADLDGKVEFLSNVGREMFKVTEEDLAVGSNIFDRVLPEDRERALCLMGELLKGHPAGFSEYRVSRRDGTVFWNESTSNLLLDAHGKAKGLFMVFRDITERKANEEKLRSYSAELESLNARLEELATTDSLTGVLNRRSFDTRLDLEMERARRFGTCFSLIMFDIDHFKLFNDRFGHATGDLVLVSVCGMVGLHIRQVDGLYRFGGEEFMVILAETRQEQALQVAEHLRSLVQELSLVHNDLPLPRVTASFGVCCSSVLASLNSAQMVEAVDMAMYGAKGAGRNCVRVTEPR